MSYLCTGVNDENIGRRLSLSPRDEAALVSTNEAAQVRYESRYNNCCKNLIRGIAKAYTI